MNRMINQKGIMPLAVAMIVVVVLVIGGSAAYYLLNFRVCCLPIQNNVNTNQNINSAQISGWKTYVNAKFGFSLQYPSSLTPSDEDDRVDFGGRTIPDATFVIQIFKPKAAYIHQKLDEYLTAVAQERLEADYKMEVVGFHDGGFEVSIDGLFPRCFFLFNESTGLVAQFYGGIDYFSSDEFKQIVSSFIFSNQPINNDINQNATITDWMTYENTKYQYQIEYPADWPVEIDGIQVWEDSVPHPEQGNTVSFFNTNTEPDGQIGSVIISVNVNENPKKFSPRDYYTEILKNPIDSYGEEDPLLRYDLVDINFKGQQSLKITDKLHEESRHTIVAKGQLIYSIILSVDNFSNGEFHIPPEQIFQGMLDSLVFAEPISLNSPSYKDLSSCSEWSKLIIEAKVFPKDLIHLCQTTTYHNILGGPFHVVEVEYGAAQDCPAGCFYDSFIGAVKESNRTITELPLKNKNYLLTTLALPDHDFKKRDFKCDADLDDITTMKFAVRDDLVGWGVDFNKPYICSWKEVKSTKVTANNTLIHAADEVTWRWDGNMFVFLKGKEYQWNIDGLITDEISRKEVTIEDRL